MKDKGYLLVQGILYAIFVLVGWTVSIGATILEWTLTPKLWGQDGFLEKEIVYKTWGIFRDLFNMLFILMLLFSAFATIFQVDKYNIRKIWLSILLAALLINFSYPIARVIIDISNVMMFSFLNGSSGLQLAADFMSQSKIEGILMPDGYAAYPVEYIIAAIIFVFVLGVTLMVLGVMMMIRLLALMVIIIVSPVGFAGSAFPGLGGYSSRWWDALFKYSFFGPIMVFVIMLANSIMAGVGEDARQDLLRASRPNGPAGNGTNGMGEDFTTWLAHAAFYMLPVIILWMGMGIARGMSIVGAGAVVGQGQKFSKWAGNLPLRGSKTGWRATGIPGSVKQAKDEFKKSGKLFGKHPLGKGFGSDALKDREAIMAGGFTDGKGGRDSARIAILRKKISEEQEKYKKENKSDKDVLDDLKSSDPATRAAAALTASNRNIIENTDQLRSALEALKNHEDLQKKVKSDIKKDNNVKLLAEYDIKYDDKTGLKGNPAEAYEKHFGGMSAENFAKQKGLQITGEENKNMKAYVDKTAKQNKEYYQEALSKLSKKDKLNWVKGKNNSGQSRQTFTGGDGI
ncbi:MAG TPA: hypothetical protein DCX32_00835 [Candidatus Moranbacteria bacterium]|nr:hypothetical protein [Candidatus Moranbacteria bacterium]